MPYNSQVDRTDVGSLIPEAYSKEIIKNVPQKSAVLTQARRLPNMSRKQFRMPVLGSLPTAYFVNGDTGLKQTTDMAWANKYVNAEELAVIVPIPEAVMADTDYDMWGEIKPALEEAIGVAIDQAILYGINAPADWPDDLLTGATAAGNLLAVGGLGAGTDLYDELLSEGGIFSLVEADGYEVKGGIAPLVMKSKLRGIRDTNGQPIFLQNAGGTMGSMQSSTQYTLDGQPLIFPKNGAIDPTKGLLLAGDFDQLVYAIRQDITWKVLDQAVIQDNTGAIIFNLAQQDMVALRVVIRLGWQLPNPINRIQPTEANRYPFAFLTPAAG